VNKEDSIFHFVFRRTAYFWYFLTVLYGLAVAVKFMNQRNSISYLAFAILLYTSVFSIAYLTTIISSNACILYENNEIIEQPFIVDTLNHRQTEKSIDFIKKNSKNPFFLVVSYTNEKTKKK